VIDADASFNPKGGRMMLASMTSRAVSVLMVAVLGLIAGVPAQVQAADQGTTTGIAFLTAKGEVKNFKAEASLWNGTFVGVSVTESRKGPLHNSGWDCTGQAVRQAGIVQIGGGFCVVTDPDGDVINLLWARTDVPGPLAGAGVVTKTKGTYLSGTGKYSGIQGYYTFSCTTVCTITSGEYKIP
jgi:hypothetical protein